MGEGTGDEDEEDMEVLALEESPRADGVPLDKPAA